MSPLANLFRSSIGRKILMAVTGVILFGFVIGHLIGNFQIFEHPDHINGYAVFLRQMGPMLWIVRLVLLASVFIHIWAATTLAVENRRARGTEEYAVKRWLSASLSSRYIRWTGYIVLAFLVFHLAQFTWGWTNRANFKDAHSYVMQHDYRVFGLTAVKAGTTVPNVYLMVYRDFQSAPVSIFYIIAVGLLSFHLLHGLDSVFQTLGLRSRRWAGVLRKIVAVICLLYFLGNLAIPGSILTGLLPPNPAAIPPVAAATSN